MNELDRDLCVTEWVSNYIFDVYTYSNVLDHFMCVKHIEVMKAIQNKATFDYIRNSENEKWYMAVLHMEFLSTKISWGCSIRGAWWDYFSQTPSTGKPLICNVGNGLLYDPKTDRQVDYIVDNNEEWEHFVNALIEFCEPHLDVEFV